MIDALSAAAAAFMASAAGIALKGLLIAAAIDFVFGVIAAFRDSTYEAMATAAWLRKHLVGRVLPIALLLVVTYATGDLVMLSGAVLAAGAYATETWASVRDSFGSILHPEPPEAVADIGEVTIRTGQASGATAEAELIMPAKNPVPTD